MREYVFVFPHSRKYRIRRFILCLATHLKRTFERSPFLRFLHASYSLLIQQNANLKYIQEQLGHGNIKITMGIYGHILEGDHRHFVHCLDDPQMSQTATQPQPALEVTHTVNH